METQRGRPAVVAAHVVGRVGGHGVVGGVREGYLAGVQLVHPHLRQVEGIVYGGLCPGVHATTTTTTTTSAVAAAAAAPAGQA